MSVINVNYLSASKSKCHLWPCLVWQKSFIMLVTEPALEAVEAGLCDEHVRVARKLTLCQRVVKICNAKKNSKLAEKYLEKFQKSQNWVYPQEPKAKIIQVRSWTTNAWRICANGDDLKLLPPHIEALAKYLTKYTTTLYLVLRQIHSTDTINCANHASTVQRSWWKFNLEEKPTLKMIN